MFTIKLVKMLGKKLGGDTRVLSLINKLKELDIEYYEYDDTKKEWIHKNAKANQ